MKKLTQKIVDYFIASKIITEEDSEIYAYGLNQGLTMIINLITTIMIGYVFGLVLESLVFMIAYIPIRSYAGGYHAKTPFRCYVLSVFTIIAVLYIMLMPIWGGATIIGLLSLSCMLIIWLAPVEDKNKPLDQIEQEFFRKRTLKILGVLVIIIALTWIINLAGISVSVTMSLALLAIMLVFGKIKNTNLKK